MTNRTPQLASIGRAWPVQLALGIVVVLFASMVVVDLVIARRVASRTEKLVENTQRSVELLEDLHAEGFELARAELRPPAIAAIKRRLTDLARQYDPIANGPGEREGWIALKTTLEKMSESAAAGGRQEELRRQTYEIDGQIDHLIQINRAAAHVYSDEIREAHRQAIIADGSVGAIVLVLCSLVALVLRRLITRQRELFAANIELLDERNRELDLFAGRAAHDMRSPLSPIRGYADLLSTGAESPTEVKQMASRIRAAVDKMARVVDDMLELSRAGRPLPGRASLRDVTGEVIGELATELSAAEVSVDVPELVVACAPGVLQQIMRNLVHNAVKFRARPRPLAIHIDARAVDEHSVELRISDNGVGMDAELAANAFQPHYRGRTDLEVPGHGLGLAIVHRTTQALGGTIKLESSPDQGSLFTLTLPSVKSTD